MAIKMESLTYLQLPNLRFIGKDVIAKGKNAGDKYGEMWAKSAEFMPVLADMNEYLFEGINDPCALMHHNNQTANKQMHYVVGRFMKSGTPVPEGFDYYDIPKSMAGFAVFSGEFTEMIDGIYVATRDKILSEGYGIPYPEGYYHAEVYLKENIPVAGVVSKMAYLFSCKAAEG